MHTFCKSKSCLLWLLWRNSTTLNAYLLIRQISRWLILFFWNWRVKHTLTQRQIHMPSCGVSWPTKFSTHLLLFFAPICTIFFFCLTSLRYRISFFSQYLGLQFISNNYFLYSAHLHWHRHRQWWPFLQLNLNVIVSIPQPMVWTKLLDWKSRIGWSSTFAY